MDKRIVLLNELSHKSSWGRNQVLKLNIDTELQNKVSSGFETKLRARNSKRHLKEKLLLSYLTYIH